MFRNNRLTIIFISIIVLILLISIIVVTIVVSKAKPKNENINNNVGDIVDEIVNGNEEQVNEPQNEIAQEPLPKIEINTIAEENSTIDGNVPCFYNPIIPKGFKAIETVQDVTIDNNAKWTRQNGYLYGLVIEDEHANQFVWIPVENMDIFKTTDWQKNEPKGEIDNTYVEPLKVEQNEYNLMYQKVRKYGGFYVGRYETGDINATQERANINNSDKMGIRKGLNVYNYVPYSQTTIDKREIIGATQLAQQFQKNNNYEGIQMSVMYGVQWDVMLRFIASNEFNVNNSTSWGNYQSSELSFTINGNEYKKNKGEVRLLLSGTSEQTKSKNIYDVAGNAYEWTKESAGTDIRVVRGGSYVATIGQLAAARYAYNRTIANNAIGFRISFYID